MSSTFCLADFLHSGALMSLPKGKLLIGWGEPQQISAKEVNLQQPAFYFSDFFLKTIQPWMQYPHWNEISKEELCDQLGSIDSHSPCVWTICQPEIFKEAFEELQQLLQEGKLQKAVPYLFTTSSQIMTPERLKTCLKKSLTALDPTRGYAYGCWENRKGIFGITPELLFSHDEHQSKHVHTMALAGTCQPSQCHVSFLANEKERQEHQLVVRGICQSVQSLGTAHVGELQLLQLPKLTHLMTPIAIELRASFVFDQLVHCLHPTPALGAFPIHEGKKWLQAFQHHTPRQFYGAPIGFQYSQQGLSQCFVGIRNVQWDSTGMRIGAGCGVIKQSTFDKEWNEIQLKIGAICHQLHLS